MSEATSTPGDGTKVFGGITLDRFCPRCVPLILRAVREQKIGVAGLCATCDAMVDADWEAKHPMPPPRDCPAPWTWMPVDGKPGMYLCLEGSSGGDVLSTDDAGRYPDEGQGIVVSSPHARELIRLAPELEAMLRRAHNEIERLQKSIDDFMLKPSTNAVAIECAAILAAIDAARMPAA